MKKSFAFLCALCFGVCLLSGCAGATPPPGPTGPAGPNGSTEPGAPATTTDEEAYVEPLVPRTTALVGAIPAGKVAADAAGKVALPPVADLEAQVAVYLKKLESDLEDIDATTKNYKAERESLLRDANALVLIALAIGLSDEAGTMKEAAPGIVDAAVSVEAATDYAAAKKAVEDVKAALTSKGDPKTLAWKKVATLGPVMKAVPNISSVVTISSNSERKMKSAKGQAATLQGTAALAAIMQGSIANYDETDKSGTAADWEGFCIAFRDLALDANTEVHKFIDGTGNYATASAALDKMKASCDDCHKVFHQAAIGK